MFKHIRFFNIAPVVDTCRHFCRFRSYEEARTFVRAQEIYSLREWAVWGRSGLRPKDIPSRPDIVYKSKGWNAFDFFGKPRVSRKIDLQDKTQREINVKVYGTNNIVQGAAVQGILMRLGASPLLEVKALDESARARILIRIRGSSLWAGAAVRAASKLSSQRQFCFNRCIGFCGMVVIFSAESHLWLRVGNELLSNAVSINPINNQWSEFEVSKNIESALVKKLNSEAVHLLPESTWNKPCSYSGRIERMLRDQVYEKICRPLGWTLVIPITHGTTVDFVLNGVRVQSKTAMHPGQKQLCFVAKISKRAGSLDGKKITQPYSENDPY
eukprot:GEMP01045088.1.p1 GENE.GEMP01045088.1~~GEMP01045088.1.p1  ORF type:complete len:328 (+),score=23.27 GEMP01045088.1:2-985(+)